MNLEETLRGRLRLRDISEICARCAGHCNDTVKAELFALIRHPDDRIAYNALWILTHFTADDLRWLRTERDALIDMLLVSEHVGRRRLILTLLDRQDFTKEEARTDYLDFCLSRINSNEPYGIRALCLKQSFSICRFFPELLAELTAEIELMENNALSPGLLSARRKVLRQISRYGSYTVMDG